VIVNHYCYRDKLRSTLTCLLYQLYRLYKGSIFTAAHAVNWQMYCACKITLYVIANHSYTKSKLSTPGYYSLSQYSTGNYCDNKIFTVAQHYLFIAWYLLWILLLLLHTGTSNPYCIVGLIKEDQEDMLASARHSVVEVFQLKGLELESEQSEVINDTINPTWNEYFELWVQIMSCTSSDLDAFHELDLCQATWWRWHLVLLLKLFLF